MSKKKKVLVTMPDGFAKERFITKETQKLLEEHFDVTYNGLGRNYTPEEIKNVTKGIDIVVTGWGTPSLSDAAQSAECSVKMIAHMAGSVGDLVSQTVYDKGIKVVSGNRLFAVSVAEGTIAYMLAAQRYIPENVTDMRSGAYWKKEGFRESRRIIGRTIGIVGCGMISKELMKMLRPFGVRIKLFSEYLQDKEWLDDMNAEQTSLDEIFESCSIVSLHSSLSEKTRGMIGREHFEKMQEDALFINTARGAIVRETEMIEALQARPDLRAFLDVYEKEPLDGESPLRKMKNVYLMPHCGGPTIDMYGEIGRAVAEDIISFADGGALQYEITASQASRMTKQH